MKHQDLFNQVKYVLGKSDYRYLEIPESDLTGCALGVAWELTDFVVISTNQLRPGVVTVSAPALSGLTNPDDIRRFALFGRQGRSTPPVG